MNEKYQKIDFIKQKYSKHSKFEISRKIWKCHLLARSVTFWHKGDTWGVTFYNYIITDILRFSSKRWRFLQFFSDLCLPIKFPFFLEISLIFCFKWTQNPNSRELLKLIYFLAGDQWRWWETSNFIIFEEKMKVSPFSLRCHLLTQRWHLRCHLL